MTDDAPAKRLLHPSLPANYFSVLDLRDRWMKQQQQKNYREEDDERKELQPNTDVQDHIERVDAEGKGFGDAERVELEAEGEGFGDDIGDRLEENEREEMQPSIEVRDDAERVEGAEDEGKGYGDGDLVEERQPVEKSAVHSNPNPKYATRRPFHGNRRQSEKRNHHRWVQVDAKAPPPPPSEAPKVENAVQVPTAIHGSEKTKKATVKRRNKKRNQKDGDLVQLQPDKRVLAPTDEKLEANHCSGVVNDRSLDGEKTKKTEQKRRNKKRNRKVEDVIQSQLKKDVLEEKQEEESKQEVEAEKENKDVDDDGSRAEIEGEFAGLSLSSAPEESSSRRSIVPRNPRGWRKDGGYGRFEQRVMLKKERAKREGGSLVWVKKGESSQIVAVPVENAGDTRV